MSIRSKMLRGVSRKLLENHRNENFMLNNNNHHHANVRKCLPHSSGMSTSDCEVPFSAGGGCRVITDLVQPSLPLMSGKPSPAHLRIDVKNVFLF